MVFELSDELSFPSPYLGEEDGLLAVGGDLSVERLVLAYNYGIFPWYDFRTEPIMWWCPMQRFVIFPNEIHISHSMRQLLNSGRYTVTFNQAFDKVIEWCGRVDYRDEMQGAWLGNKIIKAYTKLHDMNFAVSVEVWADSSTLVGDERYLGAYQDAEHGTLVGGLYGLALGTSPGAKARYNFFGESMFSLAPSASKFALIKLAERMADSGGLIDCQFETPHLKTMGGRHIHYDEYMRYLKDENFILEM